MHRIRYITKDVERTSLQITLEGYSPETGWSGGGDTIYMKEIMDNTIEL